jgi:hypothetical protein
MEKSAAIKNFRDFFKICAITDMSGRLAIARDRNRALRYE